MPASETDPDRERLPASPRFLAPRLAVIVFLIVITWQIWGALSGAIVAAAAYVSYTKPGRRPRWWYPAGWPAQGSIAPAFSTRHGGPALSAGELCELLNSRLARTHMTP